MRSGLLYLFLFLILLKLILRLPPGMLPESRSQAADIDGVAIMGDVGSAHQPEIEASGLLYLPDAKHFLLLSDETRNHQPLVYMMAPSGQVTKRIPIQGIPSIDDMEAICSGINGDIFLSSSQSITRKGRISEDRKRLLRLAMSGSELVVKDQVLLYDLLQKAIADSPDSALSAQFLLRDGQMDIDIEGLFFNDGALFLGLKAPQDEGRAIVLKIADIEKVFRHNRIPNGGITVWRLFSLIEPTLNLPMRISDFCYFRERLFILSCTKVENQLFPGKTDPKKIGCLWMYDERDDKLRFLNTFHNLQPEGIAVLPGGGEGDSGSLHIVCDGGGKKPSQHLVIPLLQGNRM